MILQIYGQQDRYATSLSSTQMVGGYSQRAKIHLPPNDYSYSDTGMFLDDATCVLQSPQNWLPTKWHQQHGTS